VGFPLARLVRKRLFTFHWAASPATLSWPMRPTALQSRARADGFSLRNLPPVDQLIDHSGPRSMSIGAERIFCIHNKAVVISATITDVLAIQETWHTQLRRKLFRSRGQVEAEGRERRGFLGRGCSPPHQLGGMGECCKFLRPDCKRILGAQRGQKTRLVAANII